MQKQLGKFHKNKSLISLVLLALLAILALNQYYQYWATRYALISPVIPKSIVEQLSLPHLYIGVILTPFTITSLLLHAYKKRTASIIISAVALLLLFLYFQYARYRHFDF